MKFVDADSAKLIAYLASNELLKSSDQRQDVCSLTAINLSIGGSSLRSVPDCMSFALGRVITGLQDTMSHEMRNSDRYKNLLPHMAATGRNREQERRKILTDWMWISVLPAVQSHADEVGVGTEWHAMSTERPQATALAAFDVADAAGRACWVNAAEHPEGSVAFASERAADTLEYLSYVAADAYDSLKTKMDGDAALSVARATQTSAWIARKTPDQFLAKIDPVGVLERATFLAP